MEFLAVVYRSVVLNQIKNCLQQYSLPVTNVQDSNTALINLRIMFTNHICFLYWDKQLSTNNSSKKLFCLLIQEVYFPLLRRRT